MPGHTRVRGSSHRETGDAAASAGDKQTCANRSATDSLRETQGQFNAFLNIAGAAIGGQALGGLIGDLSKTADAYSNLAAGIKLTTCEGAAFDSALEGVFDVARRTDSTVDETGNLFTKLAEAGKPIGLSERRHPGPDRDDQSVDPTVGRVGGRLASGDHPTDSGFAIGCPARG